MHSAGQRFTVFEVGGQIHYYVVGNFDRGLQVGATHAGTHADQAQLYPLLNLNLGWSF